MADFDFSTLITDRTPTDLDALRALLSTPMADWTAEQLAEFNLAVSKGAYNYTDLNRVTACMDYLNERLVGYGYATGYQKIKIPHKGGSRLPEGYTELEYIESSGTQYVDTGFKPNQDTRVVMKTQLTADASTSWVFGARNSNTDGTIGVFWYPNTNTWSADYDGNSQRYLFPGSIGPLDLIEIDYNKNEVSLNNSSHSFSSQAFQNSNTLALLAINTAGTVSSYSHAKICSCTIYDNGTLIRDYVPCTNPSGQVGLYDLENGEFYGNAGSGAFTAGPEAAPLPDPSKDSYTWYEEDLPPPPLMAAYLANVTALRGVLTLGENTPAVPSDMAGLTLTEANAIEQILDAINDYLGAMQAVFLRSGMAWAISGGPNFYFQN